LEPPSLDASYFILALFQTPDLGVLVSIVIALILLMCSALISGSEVAYFSLEPADIDQFEQDDGKTSSRILKLLERPERLLATILIANNFVNIGIVVVFTYIVTGIMNFEGYPLWVPFVVQVVVVTSLLLLLGEIIPKVYATVNSKSLCAFMSLPLEVLSKIFYPLSKVLLATSNALQRRVKARQADFSVDELETALELTKDEETTPDEEKILKGIVRFGNTDVKQIMTPRTEVVCYDITMPYLELMGDLTEQGFSRIPIYRESLDNVIGVLYLKDLLPYSGEEDLNWQKLLRSPYFVPENKKLDDLLKEFQEMKMHMAIVVDEYGGTSGIVTLEDIIEEIVGEITDEYDDESIFYSKLDHANYIFEGKTPLVDLYKILDIDGENFENAKGDSDTLAGFILELSGKIPMKNEKIKFENYVLTVEAADKRKVKRVKLTILEPEEPVDD
jgi:gliding motility-associated protein GldE